MKRGFDALAASTFDIIVVGGGIIGAGIARDAALRGCRTLLLEKDDFASGTTSRSSRLIHGGLRYLRKFELGLVRQDLRERDTLMSIAPHLVHPMPFLIPVSRSSPLQRLVLPLGLLLYDRLYLRKTLPSHRRLSRRETLDLEPNLELAGLAGSFLYYDCQAPFVERLCLENALSAVEHGAAVLNHARVTGFLRSGSNVSGVRVEDTISGEAYEARGRMVVNASGHWVDSVRELAGRPSRPMVRRTKGSHLLTPQVSQHAVVLFALADGRLFFVTPWQGYSYIGTTDTDYSGDLDTVEADAQDVAYLLREARRSFPGIDSKDIFYTSAGLRSLAGTLSGRASDVSRDHKLVDHEKKDGIGGLFSVLGGKITAYRAVAEHTVNLLCRKVGHEGRSSTAEAPLPGAPAVTEESLRQAAESSDVPLAAVTHLVALYGSRFYQILDLVRDHPELGRPLCPHNPDVLAQVRHAVEHEGALTVGDFLLRRSPAGLGPCQGLDAVEDVTREMGSLLGWSPVEQQRQMEAYRAATAAGQRFRTG